MHCGNAAGNARKGDRVLAIQAVCRSSADLNLVRAAAVSSNRSKRNGCVTRGVRARLGIGECRCGGRACNRECPVERGARPAVDTRDLDALTHAVVVDLACGDCDDVRRSDKRSRPVGVLGADWEPRHDEFLEQPVGVDKTRLAARPKPRARELRVHRGEHPEEEHVGTIRGGRRARVCLHQSDARLIGHEVEPRPVRERNVLIDLHIELLAGAVARGAHCNVVEGNVEGRVARGA